MRARLVSSKREDGGVAVLQVNGEQVYAMDCLSYGPADPPSVGEEFEVEFSCLHAEGETWEDVFSANPGQERKLERNGLWSYRALGRLVCVKSSENESALIDCGLCCLPAPIEISDERAVGEYVGFSVQRLDAWRKNAA